MAEYVPMPDPIGGILMTGPAQATLTPAAFSKPSTELVANLDVELASCPATGLPISISSGVRSTCYIACPTAAYIDYGIEELRHFSNRPVVTAAARCAVSGLRPLLRATGWDRQVQINNWLLSTNPLPEDPAAAIGRMTEAALDMYPGHAVVLRSINAVSDASLLDDLAVRGFRLVPSRQVYLRPPASPRTRDMKNDIRDLRRSGLYWKRGIDFTSAEFVAVTHLYNRLYIDKYTQLNPHYTPFFLEGLAREGLLDLWALNRGQEMCAVIGLFRAGNTLTSPIVGFDTSAPRSQGLYRLVSTKVFEIGDATGCWLNLSAGAAAYKRTRGAVPALEFMAVYDRDLPLRNRAAGRAVESLLTRVAAPLVQRFEL